MQAHASACHLPLEGDELHPVKGVGGVEVAGQAEGEGKQDLLLMQRRLLAWWLAGLAWTQ